MSVASFLKPLIAKHGINDQQAIADEARHMLLTHQVPADVTESAFMTGIYAGISSAAYDDRQKHIEQARKRTGIATKGQRSRPKPPPVPARVVWDYSVQYLGGKRLGDCTKEDIINLVAKLRKEAYGKLHVADVMEKGILAKWGRGKTVRTAIKQADADLAVAALKLEGE